MRQLLLVSLLFCLSLQVACSKGQQTTTHAAREPEAKMTDSDLKSIVEGKLNSDPELREASLSVSADADKNAVTLSGKVESEALRTKAVEMARSANPGITVTDKIDVSPREVSRSEYTEDQARAESERAKENKESVGNNIDDAWIHSKIVAKLMTDKDTPERKINVDVNRNVVTLRGTVDSMMEKQEAERIAKETDGVKRVNNLLRVKAEAQRTK
jgi:osmotically-inducible protein OsmY